MAGKYQQGTYSTEDYELGRGILYLSELDSSGRPVTWRDMGNNVSLTLSVAEEELEHLSTRTGLKLRDKTVTISKDLGLSFVLDTISDENQALFLSGELADYTNPTVAGFAEWAWIVDDTLTKVSRWYQVTDSNGDPALGITGTDLTLASTNATPVTLVEGTDYVLMPTEGLVRFLDSTEVQAIISNSEGVTAELAANVSAVNADEIRALRQDDIVVALKFVGENPANGDQVTIWDFHKVKLRADGDQGLISDEWREIPMAGSIEANEEASPNSPHLTIRSLKTDDSSV